MLITILQLTTIVAVTGDEFHYPASEKTVYEARCGNRHISLIEFNDSLVLKKDKQQQNLAGTGFFKSYSNGSYLGKFSISCSREAGAFSVNFFGVEIPQSGAPAVAAGSVTLNPDFSVVRDSPIGRHDANLYNFNRKRLDSISANNR
nr:hypothetical protein [uncultured Duganella sp.]